MSKGLATLGGCQSRPCLTCTEAPPNWASDSHTNPLPPHCPFVKPMISAGILLQNWLAPGPMSFHSPQQPQLARREWLYPCSQGRISLISYLSDEKSKSSVLNLKSGNYSKLIGFADCNAVYGRDDVEKIRSQTRNLEQIFPSKSCEHNFLNWLWSWLFVCLIWNLRFTVFYNSCLISR